MDPLLEKFGEDGPGVQHGRTGQFFRCPHRKHETLRGKSADNFCVLEVRCII